MSEWPQFPLPRVFVIEAWDTGRGNHTASATGVCDAEGRWAKIYLLPAPRLLVGALAHRDHGVDVPQRSGANRWRRSRKARTSPTCCTPPAADADVCRALGKGGAGGYCMAAKKPSMMASVSWTDRAACLAIVTVHNLRSGNLEV
jgi:hypothetical protein